MFQQIEGYHSLETLLKQMNKSEAFEESEILDLLDFEVLFAVKSRSFAKFFEDKVGTYDWLDSGLSEAKEWL